jgi:hypothetical protein
MTISSLVPNLPFDQLILAVLGLASLPLSYTYKWVGLLLYYTYFSLWFFLALGDDFDFKIEPVVFCLVMGFVSTHYVLGSFGPLPPDHPALTRAACFLYILCAWLIFRPYDWRILVSFLVLDSYIRFTHTVEFNLVQTRQRIYSQDDSPMSVAAGADDEVAG